MMVSNIDLLRDDRENSDKQNKRLAEKTDASHNDGTAEQSGVHQTRAPSNASSSTNDTQDGSGSENVEMSGILTRILDHIENTDRKNSHALDSINTRLDSLSRHVQTQQVNKASSDSSDLQIQVSGLTKHINSAKEAWSGHSPRTVFEERLTELTNQIDAASNDAPAPQTTEHQAPIDAEVTPGLTRLGHLHSEFTEAAQTGADMTVEVVDSSSIYTRRVNQTPDIDQHVHDTDAPPRSSEISEADPVTRSFDDEMTAAGLTDEREQTLSSSQNAGTSPNDTGKDALEAFAMDLEDGDLDKQSVNATSPSTNASMEAAGTNPISLPAAHSEFHADTPPALIPGMKSAAESNQRLDQLVAKFEAILETRNTEPLLHAIETQIAELPSYFDREEGRQHRIELIETNIASLTAMIQNTNQAIAELSAKIAEETASHIVNKLDWGTSADKLEAIDEYLRGLKESENQKIAQSENTLEGVYDALERMIGRLDAMEPSSSEAETIAQNPLAAISDSITEEDNAFYEDAEAEQDLPTHTQEQQNFTARSARASKKPIKTDLNNASHNKTKPASRVAAVHAAEILDDLQQADDAAFYGEEPDIDIADDDETYGAAAARNAPSSQMGDRWDTHVPPYIAANQTRKSRSNGVHWAKKHQMGFIAASMVLLSASAGLLLSQLPFFHGETSADNNARQISNIQPSLINDNEAALRPTGSLGQPGSSTAIPKLRAAPGVSFSDRQAPGTARETTPQYQNNPDLTASRKAPPAAQPKAAKVPPGVAIGHVSEKSIRHQLHQSVRQQQIAELSGKGQPHMLPSALSQKQPIAPTQQRQTVQTMQQQAALNVPTPSTAASRKPLPPSQIGPMSLRVSAAEGDAAAEYEVGARYARGLGVSQDLTEAARWFKRAAAKGYAPAQYRLATHFERGAGVPKDLDRAKIWYRRSADTGNIKAMHNLAVLHTGRDGVKADYTTASGWFQKAASYGLADSQYNLAILYENGLGVEKNLTKAYKWLTLASLSGDKEAGKRRDILRAQLETSAIASAERSALEWQKKIAIKSANVEFTGAGPTAMSRNAPTGGSSAQSSFAPRRAVATAPSVVPAPIPAPTTAAVPALTTQQAAQPTPPKEPDPLVRKAQLLLSKLGYDTGPADGQVGPKTRNAIIAFERRAGMPITGDVSLDLLKRLASLSI